MSLLLVSGYYVLQQQFSFTGIIELLESRLAAIKASGWNFLLPFIFIFIFCLRPVLLIPTFVMNFVAYAIFGPIEGFFVVMAAEQISALTLYLAIKNLAGTGFKNGILKMAKKMRLNVHDQSHKQFYFVTVLRLASLPFDFVTSLCALSQIRLKPFLLATLLVSMPWVALFFLITSSVQKGSWLETAISIATFSGFIILSGVVARRTGIFDIESDQNNASIEN
ncbi:MAG: hypothetical protein OHK0017_10630 [Patescibacteria group bacterium]